MSRVSPSVCLALFGFAAAAVAVGLACASHAHGTAAAAQSEAACRRDCNGEWGLHGISQTPSCNCRARDAGRTCRDDDDCEGQCIAHVGGDGAVEREVVDRGPPPRGYFLGRCSAFRATYGCERFIAAGARKQGPVSLERPPEELCAD